MEKQDLTPPSTPPSTPPTNADNEINSSNNSSNENLKFQKSLTENLNSRFYKSNNNNNDNDNDNNIDYKNFNSLKDFGYYYNDKNQLRSIEGEEKFKFINQEHYDRLGDIIVSTIQDMMKSQPYDLNEVWIPDEKNLDDKVAKSNIFLSKDFYDNSNNLLVLINGSGAVKSGQWARSLCINDSLDTGTILPYLKEAKDNGFSIIVLNPNFNYIEESTNVSSSSSSQENDQPLKKKKKVERIYVKGSESSQDHVLYVYDNFISKSPAKNIVIVAHSFGGINTCHLLDNRNEQLKDRLAAIALTDSVHSISSKSSDFTKSFFKDESKTINYVRSDEKVGTDLGFSKSQGCRIASAGHTVHEFTSAFCKKPLFNFILNILKK